MVAFFPWQSALRSKRVWFSLLVMLALGLVAALAPQIAPHDPYRWSLTAEQANRPPVWMQAGPKPGLADFPLGTDRFGRDILSRLVYGTRTAFLIALAAVPAAALIGALLGLIAGYAGGKLDAAILFLTDMVQSLPGIMFLVIIVLIFRSQLTPTWAHGLLTLVVGFASISWTNLARLVRINVLLIKEKVFVEASFALGASSRQIIANHLAPNVLHVILVWIINNIPAVILLEAVLGYIGVGVTGAVDGGEFTVVSWGGLFYSGRSALSSNPSMLVLPSLGILLMSMSFILLGNFINEISRQE